MSMMNSTVMNQVMGTEEKDKDDMMKSLANSRSTPLYQRQLSHVVYETNIPSRR
jgi:hypothetical protein